MNVSKTNYYSKENYNWDDIEPLPIDVEGVQVSQILYSDEYRQVLGLLRALQSQKEYSERALFITQEAIKLNAAHYTVWQYRYHNIIELGKDIEEELEWVEDIALDNIKNYQIWNYRQLLLKKQETPNPKKEFPLIQVMLDDDPKNYHVWSHRKWLVQFFNKYDEELPFVDYFIEHDVYNNSAWSHRFFTIFSQVEKSGKAITDEIFEEEVEYTKDQIKIAPQNVSSWNYLIGLYESSGKELSNLEEFVLTYANVLNEGSDLESLKSIPALEILIKIYSKSNKSLASKGYDLLSTKYDPIRKNYWEYQKKQITTV
ncbi:hypothetical protein BN7_555 [Wickerhamomyces ciferrii]|uniref:Protein farnesyltransferase/geranylgeranyltransferase type-1 subunit alpha n=1 Tax=Wickerhamomyces ciferrii (strain ATCC 14091 / BCRC 22168 / CBS 111 / JCM 3599 / NBRC 0793 / NRRL Y-1031 F-60-10) TaxID=1206466 RepID=K0KIM9_WICCF|nr:uncharacterized protein BN7_555 [Wickerhamomyces ciferrii]CCH41018.1 hypothetical protein BN7_555 [Wickerhamomyces ciferrii]